MSPYYVNPVDWISWLSLNLKIYLPNQDACIAKPNQGQDVNPDSWCDRPGLSKLAIYATTTQEGFKMCVHVHKSNTSLNLKNWIGRLPVPSKFGYV